MKVNYDTLGLQEDKAHEFSCEASLLGLAPGKFPRVIETNMGNRQPFVFCPQHSSPEWVGYRQSMGCITLRVFNT